MLNPPDTTQGVVLSGTIEGEVPRLVRTDVEYAVKYVIGYTPPPMALPIYENVRSTISYEDRLVQTGDGWRVQLNLSEDYTTVWSEVSRDTGFVASQGITLLVLMPYRRHDTGSAHPLCIPISVCVASSGRSTLPGTISSTKRYDIPESTSDPWNARAS